MTKTLLLTLCLLTPLARAHAQSFEVATIKPNPTADPKQGQWSLPNTGSFKASGLTLAMLMHLAWDVDISQIANQPSWLDSDLFDVAAKPEAGITLSRDELRPRLQNLLEQRFHLTIHHETRMLPGYALVVAKGGPKLQPPTQPARLPNYRRGVYKGHVNILNCTMPFLAQQLTPFAGFPVVDQTGLTGSYDISVLYAPDPNSDTGADSTLPSLFTAIRENLGLELRSRKVPVETIVIEHVDRQPTQN
jgi:uncharacterized protein (TIGR03435 family)